jgi:hypothetical protein
MRNRWRRADEACDLQTREQDSSVTLSSRRSVKISLISCCDNCRHVALCMHDRARFVVATAVCEDDARTTYKAMSRWQTFDHDFLLASIHPLFPRHNVRFRWVTGSSSDSDGHTVYD